MISGKLLRSLRPRWFGIGAIGLLLVWTAGDWMHSRKVAEELADWERTVRRDADGIAIGAEAYTVGEGPTAVLLVHGINSSPDIWKRVAPKLADAGMTVRAMRLPGFATPIEQYASARKEDWLAAVDEEIRSLRQSHASVTIMGHSLGGAISLAYVLDHPGAVDALVLLAPAVEVSDERSPVLPVRWWHEFGKRTLLFSWNTHSPFEADCLDPEGRDHAGQTPFTPVAVADQTFQLIDHNRGRASEVKTPLLLFLSRGDQAIDWRAAAEFFDQVPGNRNRLVFLENSGHVIPLDYDWPIVADAVTEFLRDLPEAETPGVDDQGPPTR